MIEPWDSSLPLLLVWIFRQFSSLIIWVWFLICPSLFFSNHSQPRWSLPFMMAHFKHVINIFSRPLKLMSTAILIDIQVHHQHWKESIPPILDIRVKCNTICLIVWRSAHQRYIHPSEYSILGENALQNWTNFSS